MSRKILLERSLLEVKQDLVLPHRKRKYIIDESNGSGAKRVCTEQLQAPSVVQSSQAKRQVLPHRKRKDIINQWDESRSKLFSETKTPTQQGNVDCEIWALTRIVHWWKDRPTKCKQTVSCKQRQHEVTQPVAGQMLGRRTHRRISVTQSCSIDEHKEAKRTKIPRKTSSPAPEQSVRESMVQQHKRTNPSTLSENSLKKRSVRGVRKVANKQETETKKRKIQEPKVHSCEKCDKHFKAMSELVAHSKIHTGEKQFQCGKCAAPFNYKSSLTRHEKTCVMSLSSQC